MKTEITGVCWYASRVNHRPSELFEGKDEHLPILHISPIPETDEF